MSSKKKQKFCVISAGVFALIFVLLIFSPKNVVPTNTEWVINGGGDNLQHYLGWRFFRNSPWTRYLLFMKNLDAPVGTSVIVTDSNPMCCLIFKLFRNLLPESFQFNGIWILSSYLLLACITAVISWQLTQDIILTLSGTIIALFNPVVLQRSLIHENLTAHWLILTAVLLFLNEEKTWNILGWLLLTEITLLVHIYFVPMIAFVFCLQIIRMLVKRVSMYKIARLCFVFIAALIAGYFVFGYSFIQSQSGSYGELSMNLNAFINPDGVSSLLPSREILPLQYEGFNYPGIGMLLLCAAGLVLGGRDEIKKIIPYIIPTILLILLAVSNDAYFDSRLVYHFDLPDRLHSMLSVFRSSGRLVWPVYYLVLFSALFFFSRSSLSKKYICMLAVICALLQAADLHDYWLSAAERFRDPSNIIADIPAELDDLIPENNKYLYVSDGDSKTIDALALYAADRHLSYNHMANARAIKPVFGGDKIDMKKLDCNMILQDSVYLYLSKEDIPDALAGCRNLIYRDINEWRIFIPDDGATVR